jgi:hypothetical protein
MKNIKKILLGTLILFGLQFGLGGCVAEVDGGGYYGGDPWYHDGPWLYGGGWYGGERRDGERHDDRRHDDESHGGVDININPPGFRR